MKQPDNLGDRRLTIAMTSQTSYNRSTTQRHRSLVDAVSWGVVRSTLSANKRRSSQGRHKSAAAMLCAYTSMCMRVVLSANTLHIHRPQFIWRVFTLPKHVVFKFTAQIEDNITIGFPLNICVPYCIFMLQAYTHL